MERGMKPSVGWVAVWIVAGRAAFERVAAHARDRLSTARLAVVPRRGKYSGWESAIGCRSLRLRNGSPVETG